MNLAIINDKLAPASRENLPENVRKDLENRGFSEASPIIRKTAFIKKLNINLPAQIVFLPSKNRKDENHNNHVVIDYAYDSHGNITKKTTRYFYYEKPPHAFDPDKGAKPFATESAALNYDPKGRLVSERTSTHDTHPDIEDRFTYQNEHAKTPGSKTTTSLSIKKRHKKEATEIQSTLLGCTIYPSPYLGQSIIMTFNGQGLDRIFLEPRNGRREDRREFLYLPDDLLSNKVLSAPFKHKAIGFEESLLNSNLEGINTDEIMFKVIEQIAILHPGILDKMVQEGSVRLQYDPNLANNEKQREFLERFNEKYFEINKLLRKYKWKKRKRKIFIQKKLEPVKHQRDLVANKLTSAFNALKKKASTEAAYFIGGLQEGRRQINQLATKAINLIPSRQQIQSYAEDTSKNLLKTAQENYEKTRFYLGQYQADVTNRLTTSVQDAQQTALKTIRIAKKVKPKLKINRPTTFSRQALVMSAALLITTVFVVGKHNPFKANDTKAPQPIQKTEAEIKDSIYKSAIKHDNSTNADIINFDALEKLSSDPADKQQNTTNRQGNQRAK